MKHILIDFENVQPEASQLSGVDDKNCHIWLFLGKLQQKTLSVELCEALCRFGKNVHFVRVAKTGKNALDFYLAYYLGKITEQDKEALICILSRDGGFDVLVEHLEDTHLCKGIVRLGSLEDAGKNEELLLEMKKQQIGQEPNLSEDKHSVEETEIVYSEPVALHQSPTFINSCVRKVIAALIPPSAFRPTVFHNLESRLHSVLYQELIPFNQEQQNEIVGKIIQSMLNKKLISFNPDTNFVNYHISSNDILEKLTCKLIESKSKTVQGARNVLRSQSKIFCLEVEENTLDDILKYCESQQLIRIKGDKIEYAPFPLEIQIPKRIDIISKEEDIKILNTVQKFFNKSAKNKPKTKKAIINSFKSILKLSDNHIEKLINVLVSQKKFSIDNLGKVNYPKK